MSPVSQFKFEAVGCTCPAGQAVSQPAALVLVTVMFSTTAVIPDDGTPPEDDPLGFVPDTWIVRVPPWVKVCPLHWASEPNSCDGLDALVSQMRYGDKAVYWPPGCEGVNEFDKAVGPVPEPLTAATVMLYCVPFVSPPSVVVREVPGTVLVAPPGEAVIIYDVMGPDPIEVGADQDTDADPSRAAATTEVGAPGTPVAARARTGPICAPKTLTTDANRTTLHRYHPLWAF